MTPSPPARCLAAAPGGRRWPCPHRGDGGSGCPSLRCRPGFLVRLRQPQMVLMSFNKSLRRGLQDSQPCASSAPSPQHRRPPRPSSTLYTPFPARRLTGGTGTARWKRFGHGQDCASQLVTKRMEFESLPLQMSPKKRQGSWNIATRARLPSAKAVSHLPSLIN